MVVHALSWLAGLAGLVGCAPGGQPGAGCDVACPVGTRRIEALSSDVIVSGQFSWSADQRCEVLCEAIQPCLAPNVPVVDGSTEPATFACRPLDGMSDIPLPSEVDTSFALRWHEVADPITSTSPVEAGQMWAHDGDGDGFDDLYVADGPEIAWLRSRGDGTFAAGGAAVVLEGGSRAAAAGDLDGDGWLDLAWITWDDELWWARATGPAAWELPRTVGALTPDGYMGVHLFVADLDADGSGDLIVQNWAASERVRVLFGGPAGPGAPVPLAISESIDVLVGWGDLDGDGRLDLATSAMRGSAFRQTPGRTFELVASGLWGLDYVVSAIELQDLDGDGLDDLWAALPAQDGCGTSGCLRSWLSHGAGLIEGPGVGIGGSPPRLFGEIDIDGDGRLEAAGATDEAAFFAASIGTGEVGGVTRASPVATYIGAAGDFDGDGLGEVAFAAGADLAVVFP